MSGPLVLLIDLERCTGCRACEAACKLENRLGEGVFRNRVWWVASQDGHALEFVNAVCQQCERPACMRVCGAEALIKDDLGVVQVDYSKCTGCQECVLACPYGAISFDPRSHHAQKCDLGANRRTQGLPPACVAACPGRAIDFGRRDELIANAQASGRRVRDLDHFGLRPSTVYLETLARPLGGGA